MPPGRYTVRLTADGQATHRAGGGHAESAGSPTSPTPTCAAQFAFSQQVRDKVNEANQAVIAIRRVKAQLADRLKKAPTTRR